MKLHKEMISKLLLLGMFASTTAASSYLDALKLDELSKLQQSLKNTKIESAIRVASITAPTFEAKTRKPTVPNPPIFKV